MTSKIQFAVENANIIEENPDSNFAILELDFFASGINRHDYYVSDETLMRTSDTIKNCPLVWLYDSRFDDVGTHSKDEIVAGFIPEKFDIKSRILEDSRKMLSVTCLVWKRFSGKLMDIFKRDGDKPVSVEMTVFDMEDMGNGYTELKDFRYDCVTVLGSLVTPAIPLAKATVMQFATDYKNDYEKEFAKKVTNFPKVGMTSDIHLNNSEFKEFDYDFALELKNEYPDLWKKYGNIDGDKSFEMWSKAKSGEYDKKVSDWVVEREKWGKRHKNDKNIRIVVSAIKRGIELNCGSEFMKTLTEKEKKPYTSYFAEGDKMPYKDVKDINPSLKGIEPPISLSQANEIARQADAIGSDDKKNGWAIAISSFKKTHKVEDGKWVKKVENSKEMEVECMNDEKFETDLEKEEKSETVEEEKAETPEKEKEEGKEEKKFSLAAYVDVGATLAMLEAETEENEEEVKMACEELKKGEECDFGLVMKGMYAKMCKMSETIKNCKGTMAAFEEKERAYMGDIEKLSAFKSKTEEGQFNFEVSATLKDIENACEMPKEEFEALKEKAKEFSIETVETWKNLAKAKAFSFASKKDKVTVNSDVTKYGVIWNVGESVAKTNSPWK